MRTLRRRPPRVVLWGGRPGIDLQAGSLEDRLRAERLRRLAAIWAGVGKALLVYRRAFVQFGVNASQATESFRRAAAATDRIAREHRARQLSGAGWSERR